MIDLMKFGKRSDRKLYEEWIFWHFKDRTCWLKASDHEYTDPHAKRQQAPLSYLNWGDERCFERALKEEERESSTELGPSIPYQISRAPWSAQDLTAESTRVTWFSSKFNPRAIPGCTVEPVWIYRLQGQPSLHPRHKWSFTVGSSSQRNSPLLGCLFPFTQISGVCFQ